MEAGTGGYYRLKVRFVEFCLEVRFRHFDVWALSEALVIWR